ncbi:MAG: pyridoxamine 5'-phosphate oxidase family protein [Thermoplasmata archaeon]
MSDEYPPCLGGSMPKSASLLHKIRSVGPGGEILHPPPGLVTPSRVLRSFRDILSSTSLCSLSTVDDRGRPHSCPVYFATDPEFRIHFLSDPRSAHCRHIRARRALSVSVYNSRQIWGGQDVGLAMDGTARECRGVAERVALEAYAERFRRYRAWIHTAEFSRYGRQYRFYTFIPNHVKIFDERRLSAALFVVAELRRRGRAGRNLGPV